MAYFPLPGEPVAFDQLVFPRARALAGALLSGDLNFVRLVECRRFGDPASEAVVVEADVELDQRPLHDIEAIERIAFVFPAGDAPPESLALRTSFPLVPHLNLQTGEGPRSLCLYELPWSEVERQWTPRAVVERARDWLALTARGGLHAPDQPLEPFLVGSYDTIVLPAQGVIEGAFPLIVQEVDAGAGRRVFVARLPPEDAPIQWGDFAVAARFVSSPRAHGLIARNPATLAELDRFFADEGDDLLGDLRQWLLHLRGAICRHPTFPQILSSPLILVIILPKTRQPGGDVKATEFRAFRCRQSVWDIGIGIGIWDRGTPAFGPNLRYQTDPGKRGEEIAVDLLDVVFDLSPELAARYSGFSGPKPHSVAAVGLGALGSQLVINLVRMGWGSWVLIDKDYLLPHNLARHAADGTDLGRPKATAMADLANATIAGPPIARDIVADILAPEQADVVAALGEADIILDASASVAVARYLAGDVSSPARRVSVFLNPVGTDAVLLAEDRERKIPLDLLEMQYYRALITDPALAQHLRRAEGPIRYGGTCRDVSVPLPQELVGLHAALGSQAVRAAAERDEATIAIWQTGGVHQGVHTFTGAPSPLVETGGNGWTLRADQWLLDKVAGLRRAKLPNETGGVLIGSFDSRRRIVYAVDAVPAPKDSKEWPHLFIRGCSGLHARVEEIRALTDGMIDYVGEWHSHPDGHDCAPSSVDREAFASLAGVMRPDALPALMLIAGQDGQYGWYIGQMREGAPSRFEAVANVASR